MVPYRLLDAGVTCNADPQTLPLPREYADGLPGRPTAPRPQLCSPLPCPSSALCLPLSSIPSVPSSRLRMGRGSWAVKGEQRGHRSASLRKDVFGGHVALQVPSLKSEELGIEGTNWARALGLATSSPPPLAFLTVLSGSGLSFPFQLHHTHGHPYSAPPS